MANGHFLGGFDRAPKPPPGYEPADYLPGDVLLDFEGTCGKKENIVYMCTGFL